jgi:acyl-CoA synthetase (AMP-forming)/AMP-acid ligase II
VAAAPGTLRGALIDRAEADPDRLAYEDDAGSVTYGELLARAEEQAARLAAMGVEQGDRVALVLSAGVAFAETFWALQLLGAVPCSLNPASPQKTLERRAEIIRARLVLTDAWLADAPAPRGNVPEAEIDPSDLAHLQFTSGTSGDPRAAMVTHANVFTYLRATHEAERAHDDDIIVAWVPPWHDLGLVRFIVGGVPFGSPCHIVQPAVRTIPQWLETMSRTRATFSGAPDFAYRLACRMVDPASVDLSSLRFTTNGGEPVRRTTIEQFEERFGLKGVVSPGYGLAENTLGAASTAPGDALVVDERGNVSCGKPLPGVEARADGDASSPAEILLRGDLVFDGYFEAPEDTARVLRDGWLHTGDVGYLDGEGRLYVLGRERAMIKRGGSVVAPRELEEAAQRVAAVRQAAAVGLPTGRDGAEIVTVVVEATLGDGVEADPLAAEVSRAVVESVAFAPERVLVWPPRTIPLTANGKVQHARLRDKLMEEISPDAGSRASAR